MSSHHEYRLAGCVFFLALAVRFGGVVVTTLTNLNPYAQADVEDFSAAADYIAEGFREGSYIVSPEFTSTVNTWGSYLAPFWLLPGPSRIYARFGMAILGAVAVYNVYLIARSLASREAAVIAVAPLFVYPSFVFVHSTVLREVAILFGMTTAARLLVVPPRNLHPLLTYVSAGGFLWFASIFRPENRPVFATVLAVAVAIKYRNYVLQTALRYIAPIAFVTSFTGALFYFRNRVDWFAELRQNRARGRTEYLGDVILESLISIIAFSWLGAVYFLFTPFPWMITRLADFVAVFEAVGNLVFAIFAVLGVRAVFHRNPTVAISLAVGIVLGAVLYGLGTANVGTAIRHRQMLLWAIFLFGGIGLSERFDFAISSDWRLADQSSSVADD